MSRRRSRALGALGVGAVSTLVAALAHGAASGSWPTPLVLAAALPFSVLLGLALLGRRVSSPRIAIAVLADQTVFHLLFSTVGQAAPAPAGGQAAHSAHGDPLAPLALLDGGAGLVVAIPAPEMIAGHVAAATLSFALLRGGWELILRAIARGAGLLIRLLDAPAAPAPLPSRRRAPAAAPLLAVRSVVLRHTLSRRGPPLPASLG